MGNAIALADTVENFQRNATAIGVFVAGDPRIDVQSISLSAIKGRKSIKL